MKASAVNQVRDIDIKIVDSSNVKESDSEVRGALAIIIQLGSRLPAEPWRVRINVASEAVVLADCRNGKIAEIANASDHFDCSISISARELLKICAGDLDPRLCLLYKRVTVEGEVSIATKVLDALGGKSFVETVVFSAPLPRPTTDLPRAKADFREFGYCLVEGAVAGSALAALRDRLVVQAAQERRIGRAWLDSGEGMAEPPNQRIWNLVNKGQVFRDLLDHPLIEAFMPEFIGDEYRLSMLSANIAGPGGEPQYLHTDQLSMQPNVPVRLGVNFFIFVDDFTAENGGTRLLPGSHKPENKIAPANIYDQSGTVAAEGAAGTALLFDSRLYHATGPNKTQTKRHAILSFFTHYWIRGIENWSLQIPPRTFDLMSERQRALCGFRSVFANGCVEGTYHGKMVRWDPESLVGELTAASAS